VYCLAAAITLQGSDWLLYNVYDADVTSSHQDMKYVAFTFKVFQRIYLLF